MLSGAVARRLRNPFRSAPRAAIAVAGAELIGALMAGPSSIRGAELTTDVGGVRVEVASAPAQPGTRQPTQYRLRLRQADGTPITGVKVTLRGRMADGMTVAAPLTPGPEPGIYVGRVLFTMEGTWELTLRIAGRDRAFELPLAEHVAR